MESAGVNTRVLQGSRGQPEFQQVACPNASPRIGSLLGSLALLCFTCFDHKVNFANVERAAC